MINDSVASDNHRYEEDISSPIADKDGIETETLLQTNMAPSTDFINNA